MPFIVMVGAYILLYRIDPALFELNATGFRTLLSAVVITIIIVIKS